MATCDDYFVVFKLDDSMSCDFKKTIETYMVQIYNIFHKCLGYKIVGIEKISFVDYANKSFYMNFPFNKKLVIESTSQSLTQIGFGKYTGYFFEVVAKVEISSKPLNFRIFFDILEDDGQSITSSALPIRKESEENNEHKIYILGEHRTYIRKGRSKYIDYNGKQISITEARKIEKDLANKEQK